MGRFLEDAQNIFEAAERVSASGQMVSDLTILVGVEGGIQMLADSDWPLDRLLAHHGARAVYRVGERAGKVRLEGRAGAQACRLETESTRQVARWVLSSAIPIPRPAEIWPLLPAGSD